MPVYSRIGPYEREILDHLAAHVSTVGERSTRVRDQELFEYWAHEASLIPFAYEPLLRWRMAGADAYMWKPVARLAREKPQLLDHVLQLVTDNGPIRGADAEPQARVRDARQMWDWSDGKIALEYLFYTGRVSSAERVNFERRYDLTERVLPPEVLAAPTPSDADAQRALVVIAAQRLGVASEEDLGDYFRLPRKISKARVAELLDAGELEAVTVQGWTMPAYVLSGARAPRAVSARALLSPFDSLIWSRPRTERLFDFNYRLEIYTPAAKRKYGYYVLPFLLDESLVARVDLKSDRKAGVLRVLGAFAESHSEPQHVATELADELLILASWLGLDSVQVTRNGDLSRPLHTQLANASR
jgi:uncharacterized protein